MKKKDDQLIEKTLSSELVYSGIFLQVKKDEVELFSGQKSVREYILHPGAALILPELDQSQLLMIKQYRHPLKEVFMEFPAGKLDPGENSLQTAHRELKEETGYEAQQMLRLTRINPVIGYANEYIDLYLARGLKKIHQQKLDEGENLYLFEIPFGQAMDLLREGKIPDVKTALALFWYEKFLEEKWPLST